MIVLVLWPGWIKRVHARLRRAMAQPGAASHMVYYRRNFISGGAQFRRTYCVSCGVPLRYDLQPAATRAQLRRATLPFRSCPIRA